MNAVAALPGFLALQQTTLPEPDLPGPVALHLRLSDGAWVEADAGTGAVLLPPGGRAAFDTWTGGFGAARWAAECRLDGLWLALAGAGAVTVEVWQIARPGAPPELLCTQALALMREGVRIDLARALAAAPPAFLWFELRARSAARLDHARFLTRAAPAAGTRLAIAITTFRREAAVARTARRLSHWLEETGTRAHVLVIDNGGTVDLPPMPHVTRLENPNLGGAGGFARGLLEAEAGGFTHVLFMDDDALFPLENIRRTHAALSLARDPALAVAGAMITQSAPDRLWEAGAVYDQRCRPRFNGTDLTDRAALVGLEAASLPPGPDNLYGGWWFFAFPLAQARHMPFPFFVRGDDVSFALANDFRILTSGGVASFQEDFSEKESPLTWYLDLRSHMVHHLALLRMERGAWRVARIGIWFFLRNLARFHYATIDAVLLAWEDVLRGPDFFAEHADMAERRARIARLGRAEAWREGPTPGRVRRVFSGRARWVRRFFGVTLNGHLLPFFGLWGDRLVLPVEERGRHAPIWGAARISYVMPDGRHYTVRLSRLRALRGGLRMAGLTLRLMWHYRALRDAYRAAYPQMTSRGFWRARLGVAAAQGESQDGAQDATLPRARRA